MQSKLCFQFIWQETKGSVDVPTSLDSTSGPAVVVPSQDSSLHPTRYFVMPHISFGTIQKSLELKAIGISIRYDVSYLTDNCGEDEDSDEVADYGEDVSVKQQTKKFYQSWSDSGRQDLDERPPPEPFSFFFQFIFIFSFNAIPF